MPVPRCSDEEFISRYRAQGPAEIARALNLDLREVNKRRKRIEQRSGAIVASPDHRAFTSSATRKVVITADAHHRIPLTVDDGVVVVAGDAHYWPGKPSLMHRALVQFIPQLKPKAVILNGDMTDLASISRFPVVNWERQPTVQEEIEVCQERLAEIADVSGKATKLWPLGNHDARFSIHLAQHAPQFAQVHGTRLKDHFPEWAACWSVCINDHTIVKHRYKGGAHATHNNLMSAGVNMVTNHLHSAKVTPFTDYTGTRWAVDCGCIADVTDRAFLYLQDDPRNWREAFAVLTFHKGLLLAPELVLKWSDTEVQWRGQIIKIK